MDIKKFAYDGLLNGFKEKTFTRSQVEVFATGYYTKGVFDLEDVESIDEEMTEWEERDETSDSEAPAGEGE